VRGRTNSGEVEREVRRLKDERLRLATGAAGGASERRAEEARELEAAGWERRGEGPRQSGAAPKADAGGSTTRPTSRCAGKGPTPGKGPPRRGRASDGPIVRVPGQSAAGRTCQNLTLEAAPGPKKT
jgi:hypothetical protein